MCLQLYAPQAISAGTSSACARTCTLFQLCSAHKKSVRAAVYVYDAHFFKKRLVYHKLESFNLENIVVISRLIQSQHQLKAASTRSAVDPDRRDILSIEIVPELLCCIVCQLNHVHLLFMFRATFDHLMICTESSSPG